ncbi:MAG TPA: response regulator [Actinomycetota bacterium]|jgi:CheY-like chemotaxis protein|nr:response regulator [Actinomycetota bacterium]
MSVDGNAALRDSALAPRSDRPRVLVVDDLPVMRKSLVELLERDGMTVVGEAEGQSAALAALEDADPDVLLLDLRSRQVNALAVVRHIRGLELPVLVVGLAGANDATAPADARAAGLFALVKGSGPWELLSAVEHAHAMLRSGA